jgi:asparagine synthase (glutamine-hydrolysing)
MCGIAGYFGSRVLPTSSVNRILAALRPRGPDAEHYVQWTSDLRRTANAAPNGLLHTRLSIIDPRPEADQPMANEAGDIWISYNGEVYDWAADARTLMAAGFRFRTRSDTEFILRAYEHWGVGCIERLRGMFAIAIVDLRRQIVYVVRDRLGLKPAVYAHRADGFAFASTVRALLPWLPRDARRLCADGIDAYLAHRTIPAPLTVFSGVARLPAAHYLRYDLSTGTLVEREYWRPEASAEPWLPTFDAAIRMRTVADRPLGLFLSSGIDSSAVACRLIETGFRGLPAFTGAFPGSTQDESEDACLTAAKLRLPSSVIAIPSTIEDSFDRIVADLDEPFADPSAIPTWHLAREAANQVQVVLSGDGGDELFAGYKRYSKHLRTRWRQGVSLPQLRAPSTLNGGAWQRIMEELRLDWPAAYVLRFSGLMPRERSYIEPDFICCAHYWRMPKGVGTSDMDVLLEIDRLNYLPEYILRKADLCTMAHGLELRAPFLDHRVFNSAWSLPAGTRITKPPKLFLSEALSPVADLGLFSRKKRGFNPPLDPWLQSDLAPRLPDLGRRLANLTSGQVAASRVDAYIGNWRRQPKQLAEQLLLLLILDESLRQLSTLCALA